MRSECSEHQKQMSRLLLYWKVVCQIDERRGSLQDIEVVCMTRRVTKTIGPSPTDLEPFSESRWVIILRMYRNIWIHWQSISLSAGPTRLVPNKRSSAKASDPLLVIWLGRRGMVLLWLLTHIENWQRLIPISPREKPSKCTRSTPRQIQSFM